MIETFAALLLAHALADFVLQTGWMVANKRRPAAMLAHVAVVLACTAAAMGSLDPILLAVVAAHLVIDAVKTHSGLRGLAPFLADQAAHLASLGALAVWAPGLWSSGLWAGLPHLPALMLIGASLILTVRAGGFAVGFLMEPWSAATPVGLPNGGRAIGALERALVFLLILTGQAGAIGLLIAAKSILRFGTTRDDRAVSEYVIIGTLASFAWAITVATFTITALGALPPLGIPDLNP
ncbi:MAG: DUF3307 domain-containing protein [Paracoccaceae bacterium]